MMRMALSPALTVEMTASTSKTAATSTAAPSRTRRTRPAESGPSVAVDRASARDGSCPGSDGWGWGGRRSASAMAWRWLSSQGESGSSIKGSES